MGCTSARRSRKPPATSFLHRPGTSPSDFKELVGLRTPRSARGGAEFVEGPGQATAVARRVAFWDRSGGDAVGACHRCSLEVARSSAFRPASAIAASSSGSTPAGRCPWRSGSLAPDVAARVTPLPVTHCQICDRTVAYRPGNLSEVLTGHYRRRTPAVTERGRSMVRPARVSAVSQARNAAPLPEMNADLGCLFCAILVAVNQAQAE